MPNGATGQISKSSTVTVTVNPVHQDLEHPKSPLNPWNTQYTKQNYAGFFYLYISGDWEIAAKVSAFLELSWNHQHQNPPYTKRTGHGKHKQTPTAVLSFSSISAATIRRTYCKAIHIAHLAWRHSEKSVLNRLDGVQDVVGRPKSKGKTSNEMRRHSRSPIQSDFWKQENWRDKHFWINHMF